MGDHELSNDPKSESLDVPASAASPQDDVDADWGFTESGTSPGYSPASDASPQPRRSSLRPAPPSFRPSARDPSQMLRPAMVVHAGDVDADVPLLDNSDPTPSNPLQSSVGVSLRPEPFALAEDYTPSEPANIPPAPVESPPAGPGVRTTLSHFGSPNRQSKPEASVNAPEAANASVQLDEPVPVPASSAVRASSRPSIPDAASAKRLNRGHVAAVLAAIVLAGVVVAMMLGRANDSTASTSAVAARAEHVDPVALAAMPIAPAAIAPAAAPAPDQAPSSDTAAQPEASAEEPSAQANAAASADPSASASSNTTHVTLDIKPTDSKVIYQGRLRSGPPYEFDVPKGKRIALEVARFGFVTQKVVLDGKKPVVIVGLRRAAGSQRGGAN